AGRAKVRLINRRAAELVGVRAALGDEVQAAIEQLTALERNRLSNLIERLQGLINLQLIGRDLIGTFSTAVGGFGHEAADVVEQVARLAQTAVGRGDNFVRTVGIADGLGDGGDVAAEVFAGDQTGRVVFTGVDPQTGAEPGQGLLQGRVGLRQRVLS